MIDFVCRQVSQTGIPIATTMANFLCRDVRPIMEVSAETIGSVVANITRYIAPAFYQCLYPENECDLLGFRCSTPETICTHAKNAMPLLVGLCAGVAMQYFCCYRRVRRERNKVISQALFFIRYGEQREEQVQNLNRQLNDVRDVRERENLERRAYLEQHLEHRRIIDDLRAELQGAEGVRIGQQAQPRHRHIDEGHQEGVPG